MSMYHPMFDLILILKSAVLSTPWYEYVVIILGVFAIWVAVNSDHFIRTWSRLLGLGLIRLPDQPIDAPDQIRLSVPQLSDKAADILRISAENDEGSAILWAHNPDIDSSNRILSISGQQIEVRVGRELRQWQEAIADLTSLGFLEASSSGIWVLTSAGWDRGEQLLVEHRPVQLSAAARELLVMIHDRGEGVCLYQRIAAGRFLRIKGQPLGGTHGRDISKWDAALRELEERGLARSDQPGMVKRPGRKRYAVRLTEAGYAE